MRLMKHMKHVPARSPVFVIDRGRKEMPIGNEDKREDGSLDDKDNNKVTNIVTNIDKKKTKTPKRRSNELIQVIKEQDSDFKERREQHHQEKMARMDRLLDLYERDIDINAKKSSN